MKGIFPELFLLSRNVFFVFFFFVGFKTLQIYTPITITITLMETVIIKMVDNVFDQTNIQHHMIKS